MADIERVEWAVRYGADGEVEAYPSREAAERSIQVSREFIAENPEEAENYGDMSVLGRSVITHIGEWLDHDTRRCPIHHIGVCEPCGWGTPEPRP